MAIPNWQRTITTETGDVVAGAEVEVVVEATGLNASLYSDRGGTTSKDNPFFADSSGFAEFYAAPGEYRITATNPNTSQTRTWRYEVLVGTSTDNEFTGVQTFTGGTAGVIQIKADTAANWTSANPTLADGEQGHETDTGRRKVGDGTTAWTSLPYPPKPPEIGAYSRNVLWRVKGYATAADRRTLVSPDAIDVDIDGILYSKVSAVELDINSTSSWDATSPATASNRAGENYYIYACVPSSGFDPDIVLSPNATIPDGYTATNSRKVGQFHCLCEDILTNVYPYENEGNDEDYVAAAYVNSALSNGDTQHWMEGMITGDILPFSVQDLLHRPHDGATREGTTFSPKDNRWGMIYLPSWDAATARLVSRYGATIADGVSSPEFHASRFDQALGGVGYMSINRQEFVNMSLGSPQGVNIAGSSDPNTTGGHEATNGQRIVSLIGMEDMTGVMYQWSRETTENSRASWGAGFDGNDKNVAGEDYSLPLRSRFGVYWDDGSLCGSRGASSSNSALHLSSNYAGRGVAEPYGGRA